MSLLESKFFPTERQLKLSNASSANWPPIYEIWNLAVGETSRAWAAFITYRLERTDTASVDDLKSNLDDFIQVALDFSESNEELIEAAKILAAQTHDFLYRAAPTSATVIDSQCADRDRARDRALLAAYQFQQLVHLARPSENALSLGLR